jgi:hypothetical protein
MANTTDRIVRTGRGAALAFHTLETDGTQLIEFIVDAQSNQVKMVHSSHARPGVDFVEAGEDRSVLEHGGQVYVGETTEASEEPQGEVSQNFDPADANQDGVVTKKERKQYENK